MFRVAAARENLHVHVHVPVVPHGFHTTYERCARVRAVGEYVADRGQRWHRVRGIGIYHLLVVRVVSAPVAEPFAIECDIPEGPLVDMEFNVYQDVFCWLVKFYVRVRQDQLARADPFIVAGRYELGTPHHAHRHLPNPQGTIGDLLIVDSLIRRPLLQAVVLSAVDDVCNHVGLVARFPDFYQQDSTVAGSDVGTQLPGDVACLTRANVSRPWKWNVQSLDCSAVQRGEVVV